MVFAAEVEDVVPASVLMVLPVVHAAGDQYDQTEDHEQGQLNAVHLFLNPTHLPTRLGEVHEYLRLHACVDDHAHDPLGVLEGRAPQQQVLLTQGGRWTAVDLLDARELVDVFVRRRAAQGASDPAVLLWEHAYVA